MPIEDNYKFLDFFVTLCYIMLQKPGSPGGRSNLKKGCAIMKTVFYGKIYRRNGRVVFFIVQLSIPKGGCSEQTSLQD